MAHYVTVFVFSEIPSPVLVESLRLTDRLREAVGNQRRDLWISWHDFHEIEAGVATALATGQVQSAAMLPAVPPPDQRWIVHEWWERLVVDSSLVHHLDRRFWADPFVYEPTDLQIFRPSPVEDLPGGHSPGAGHHRGKWVESTVEYRQSMDTERPTLITAPARQILTRMKDWFGELADERVGGAIAILALSGVTPSAETDVVLRNPAALGLRRVTGPTCLAVHRKMGRIRAQAWGTSANEPTRGIARSVGSWVGSEAMTAEFGSLKRRTGASYGLVIDLRAEVDPEVLIDTGLVFEQESLNGVQTLATASGKVTQVEIGRPVTVALPAWCLNRNLSPPSGQETRPTPLYLPLTEDTNQGAVWDTVEQARDRFGTGR